MAMKTIEDESSVCVVCGKKLSFFQRLSKRGFCGDAHQQFHDSKKAEAMMKRLLTFEQTAQ